MSTAPDGLTATVEDLLRRAAAAHHLHELALGGPHAEWEPWYADHIARTLTEQGYRLVRDETP